MKKTIIKIALLAIVVFLVAVWYFIKNTTSENSTSKELVNNQNTSEVAKEVDKLPTSGEGTLKDLLAKGVNIECSIRHKVDDLTEEVEGTYFTGYGKMRGDFVINISGKDSVSSMILKDDIMYSWSEIDGEKYGVKIDTKKVSEQQSRGEVPETNEPVPLDDVVKYDCKPWVKVDESIFEPPTDIIFKDFNSIINTGMEYGTIYEDNVDKEEQCKLCSQVPAGESRDSCMSAFNCQ